MCLLISFVLMGGCKDKINEIEYRSYSSLRILPRVKNKFFGIWVMDDGPEMSRYLGRKNNDHKYCMNFQPESGYAEVIFNRETRQYTIKVVKLDLYNYIFVFNFKERGVRIRVADNRDLHPDMLHTYLHFKDSVGGIKESYDGFFENYKDMNSCLRDLNYKRAIIESL